MNIYVPYILPSEYQEVEYIQSSWTQYIDTGYTYTNPNKVKYELSYNLTSSSNFSYFGSRTQSGTWYWYSWIPYGWKIYTNTTNFWSIATSTNTNYVLSLEFIPSSNTAELIQYTNDTITYNQTFSSSSYMPPTQTKHIWLFCDINWDWSAIQFASMKAYSFKIWDNDSLVRDFIPCYRKSDWVIWMYDLENDQFYTNSWAWTFTKWADVNFKIKEVQNIYIGEYSWRLPIGYKEVEYIQSSWTQYIDTWYTPNKNVKIEMDFAYTSTSPTQQRLFWVRSASTSSFTFDIYINGWWWYGWSATDWEDGVWWFINTYITVDTNKHKVIHSNTQTQILTNWTSIYNNTRTWYITTGNNALWPIPLFAGFNYIENPNWYSLFAYLKIYSCKIWNWDTLVRELVPCYRKSDSVIWMYDLVNNQFYTNSWTWTFTKWPNVN